MASIVKRETSKGVSYLITTNFHDKTLQKKIRKSTTWTPPANLSPKEIEKELQIVAEAFEQEIKENISFGLQDNDYTVESYSKIYLDYLTRSFSPTYYTRAIDIFRYINKRIGHIKLKDLNPAIIQDYFDQVENDKKITEKIVPRKSFNTTLEEQGLTYHILRYKLHVQHATLSKAMHGKNVEQVWADSFCEKTNIPFELLFQYKTTQSEYAYNTKKKRKTYLRQLLAYAKRQRVIKENYATADFVVYTKEGAIKDIEAMDEAQARTFYDVLLSYPDIRIKTSLLLFLLTGFRRGEVAGLKWDDVDFRTNKITIKRNALEIRHQGVILKEPKTKKSARTITMPTLLIQQLKEYKEWQDNLIPKLGDYYHNENWLFTRDNGMIIRPSTFLEWMKKVLKKANLPHFTIHSLRHTNITLQITAGVPLVTVSGRAGHSRTSTTTDIYSHFIQSSDNVAASTLDNLFQAEPKEAVNKELEEFKKIKQEMKQLGFETIKDYMEFLEFKQARSKL